MTDQAVICVAITCKRNFLLTVAIIVKVRQGLDLSFMQNHGSLLAVKRFQVWKCGQLSIYKCTNHGQENGVCGTDW